MPIKLTPLQSFQNTVNGLISQTNNLIDVRNPSGLISNYNKIYATIFTYDGQTPAAVIAQLATNAGNVLAIITAYRTFLVAIGVTDLAAIPAYITNQDGTVTLS